MTIPRSSLLLGLAGLLPFVWGLCTYWSVPANDLTITWLGPRYVGPFVSLTYGSIILSFMSGALWGFSTRAAPTVAGVFYALSVLPALWVFLLVGNGVESSARFLIAGFAGLLCLDALFVWQKLAPTWWLRLRIGLTIAVALCLAPFV